MLYEVITQHLKAEYINNYNDILVFDKTFSWTYCHTHEENCGPYFYNKKNLPFSSDFNAIKTLISDDNQFI